METKEIQKQEGPAALIQAAISGGADLEKLEKLMLLQERYEKREAEKEYVAAMAAFKANPPKIEKKKLVSFSTSKGVTEYRHAMLADAAEKINKALSQHGLSAAWSTSQEGKSITVTCKITHAMGHSEQTSITAQADESGGKNSIQAIGSTISYLERYTLLALTGLASHDMDDDGVRSSTAPITDEQVELLRGIIPENYEQTFVQWLKVDCLEELPARDFIKAKTALEGINKKAKKKEITEEERQAAEGWANVIDSLFNRGDLKEFRAWWKENEPAIKKECPVEYTDVYEKWVEAGKSLSMKNTGGGE